MAGNRKQRRAAAAVRRTLARKVEVPLEDETFVLTVPDESKLDELTGAIEKMADTEVRGPAALRMAARAVIACLGEEGEGLEVGDMVRFIAATGGFAGCPLVAPAMRMCGMSPSAEADPAADPT